MPQNDIQREPAESLIRVLPAVDTADVEQPFLPRRSGNEETFNSGAGSGYSNWWWEGAVIDVMSCDILGLIEEKLAHKRVFRGVMDE